MESQLWDLLNNLSHNIIKIKRGNAIIKQSRNFDDEFIDYVCKEAGVGYKIEHHFGRKPNQVIPIGDSGEVYQYQGADEKYVYLKSNVSNNKVIIRII